MIFRFNCKIQSMKTKNDIGNFLSLQAIFHHKIHNKNDVGAIIQILDIENDIQNAHNANDEYNNDEIHYDNITQFFFFGKYKN